MTMTMEEFIDEHRDELLIIIAPAVRNCQLTDEEIEARIAEDEDLRDWAVGEGVTGI